MPFLLMCDLGTSKVLYIHCCLSVTSFRAWSLLAIVCHSMSITCPLWAFHSVSFETQTKVWSFHLLVKLFQRLSFLAFFLKISLVLLYSSSWSFTKSIIASSELARRMLVILPFFLLYWKDDWLISSAASSYISLSVLCPFSCASSLCGLWVSSPVSSICSLSSLSFLPHSL